ASVTDHPPGGGRPCRGRRAWEASCGAIAAAAHSMKTQDYAPASLDGFLATKAPSLDWLSQVGVRAHTGPPDFIREVGALAMGSSTFEWMLPPVVAAGQAWPYGQPTWVFSRRRLETVPGADIRFVAGDVRPVHRQMRDAAAGRNIWLVGSGDL